MTSFTHDKVKDRCGTIKSQSLDQEPLQSVDRDLGACLGREHSMVDKYCTFCL